MKLYKLTSELYQTYNQTQWGENIFHEVSGEGKMCSSGWLHAYTSPLLAVLMNPVHANFKYPILWEAEGEIGVSDGIKVGCKRLTTLKQIPLLKVTIEQRIKFGILCAKKVCKEEKWNEWADKWLKGEDRSVSAARAAADAARAAAAYAAYYAARAANDAYYAASAVRSAVFSADADAEAANENINFEQIAEESVK